MPRSSNASQRREVLRVMAAVKRRADKVRRSWDVTGLVYGATPPDAQATRHGYVRPRAEGEYPENTLDGWAQVYNETDEMIEQLVELRKQALDRYKTLASRAVTQ